MWGGKSSAVSRPIHWKTLSCGWVVVVVVVVVDMLSQQQQQISSSCSSVCSSSSSWSLSAIQNFYANFVWYCRFWPLYNLFAFIFYSGAHLNLNWVIDAPTTTRETTAAASVAAALCCAANLWAAPQRGTNATWRRSRVRRRQWQRLPFCQLLPCGF